MIDVVSFINPQLVIETFLAVFVFAPIFIFFSVFPADLSWAYLPISILYSLFLVSNFVFVVSKISQFKATDKIIKLKLQKIFTISLAYSLVISTLTILFMSYLNWSEPVKYYQDTQRWIEVKRPEVELLFTKQFELSRSCFASGQSSDYCSGLSQSVIRPIFENYDITDPGSTYFIRLSPENRIQKLHQSGNFVEKFPSTRGERLVAKMLRGNHQFLLGAYADQSIESNFLKDAYSEFEVIVPVQINGKTIGAFVRLFAS